MKPEHLDYFRALLEGEDVPPWHVWWPEHVDELDGLPRTRFLRLKFQKLEAAAEELALAGVSFEWSPRGRVAATFASHAPRLLDEHGLPKIELFRRAFGGIVPAFEKGDPVRGRRLIQRRIKGILRQEPIVRAQELGELELDAEYLFTAGCEEAALGILRAISQVDEEDDLLHAAVEHAEAFVREHGAS